MAAGGCLLEAAFSILQSPDIGDKVCALRLLGPASSPHTLCCSPSLVTAPFLINFFLIASLSTKLTRIVALGVMQV